MMVDLRPEYRLVLSAMSETDASTPQDLAEKVGSIHIVILALVSLFYDGFVDIPKYRRTPAGTQALLMAGIQAQPHASSVITVEDIIESGDPADQLDRYQPLLAPIVADIAPMSA